MRRRLLRDMRGGAFPEGRLPRETDLARTLGVSRATVRAALQTLAEDGVVSRRRRHGTVVNDHMLHRALPLNRLVSFRELVEQSGHEASVDPLVRRVELPSAAVAAALELAPEEPCLVVERLLRADGRPVVTVTDTVALSALLVAPEDVADADTTFSFVAASTGAAVDHSFADIAPRVATATDPAHLELPAGTPYTQLSEVLFTATQEPVAFSLIAVDVRRVKLGLVRQGG